MVRALFGQRQLTATELGWLMSFIGCTACAIISISLMITFLPPSGIIGNSRWFDIAFVICVSYTQLFASTLSHSPVERDGDVVKGMIFSDLGDDSVHMSIRSWMWFWFISPFLHSVFITFFLVLILYGMAQEKLAEFNL